MTVLVPLDVGSNPSSSSSPSFVTASAAPNVHLAKTMAAIMKARRIVVICGAGISVRAGIPDFRSSEGLFQSIKRDNPREQLSSGKELFDASVFNSEHKTSLFCQMIAQLSDLSQSAQPTPFHNLLRALDDRGRLLRVYTQNIDAIEQKSGLSFGVPEFDDRRHKSRSKGKQKEVDDQPPVVDPTIVASCDHHAVGPSAVQPTVPSISSAAAAAASSPTAGPSTSANRLPSPPVETPRCIPLHGTLQAMHCQICTRSFPLSDYLPALNAGQPPPCPECTTLETNRQLVGKRPRGIGRLRPSVVLYNEDHKDGEGVGEVVRKDLMGGSKGKGRGGADLVLVVGTSLRVPGTKRMVREFSKAVRARAGVGAKDESEKTPSKDKDRTTTRSGGLSTPAPSPRRTPSTDDDAMASPPKAVYLNLDFPVPTREWEGVFDVWIQGDAQQFADLLKTEIEKETKTRVETSEKKKRKEEEMVEDAEDTLPDGSLLLEKTQKTKGGKKDNVPPEKVTKGKQKEKDGKPQAKRKPLANNRAVTTSQETDSPALVKRRKTGKDAKAATDSSSPHKSQSRPGTPLSPPYTPTSRLLSAKDAKARAKLASAATRPSEPTDSLHAKLFLRIPPRGAGPGTVLLRDDDLPLPPPLPAAGVCIGSSSSNEESDEDTTGVSADSTADSDDALAAATAPVHVSPKGRRYATPPRPQDAWAPTYSPGASTSTLPTTAHVRRGSDLLQGHEDVRNSRYGNMRSDYDLSAYEAGCGPAHRQDLMGDLSPLTAFSDEGATSDTLSDRDEDMDVDVVGDDMEVDDLHHHQRRASAHARDWYPTAARRTPHRRNSSPGFVARSPPRHADYSRDDELYSNPYRYYVRRDTYPPIQHPHPHSQSYSYSHHSYAPMQYYHHHHHHHHHHNPPQPATHDHHGNHGEYANRHYSPYAAHNYSYTTAYQQYASQSHPHPPSAPLSSYPRPPAPTTSMSSSSFSSLSSSHHHQHTHSHSSRSREARRERERGHGRVAAPPLNAHRQLSSGVLISTAPLYSGIRDTTS